MLDFFIVKTQNKNDADFCPRRVLLVFVVELIVVLFIVVFVLIVLVLIVIILVVFVLIVFIVFVVHKNHPAFSIIVYFKRGDYSLFYIEQNFSIFSG